MKVAVYGAGGVGAYFGGRLAQAGADVQLIARGAHLAALRDRGLELRSVKGDAHLDLPATDDPHEIGPCDYVLFCVKSFDTASAAARLAPLLHEETGVLSLQNGIDNEDGIAGAVGSREHVMGGAAFIFSTIAEPGVVEHTGGPARIVFGELHETTSTRGERLRALCQQAGVDAELSANIRAVLWSKLAFICAQAGITALTRLPLGDIRSTPASWELFRRVVAEIVAVAAAERVVLPEDAVERHMALAQGLDAGSFSSLHYDLTHNKPIELDALHGAVVRRAASHGVPVPACETIHALLAPWAERLTRTDADSGAR